MTDLIYSGHRFQCFATTHTGDFLHMHKEVELLYIINGDMGLTVNGIEYVAKEGDFVLIFPYTIHKVAEIGNLEYLLCTFDVDILPFFANTFHYYSAIGSPVQRKDGVSPEALHCVGEIVKRKELQQHTNITLGYLTIIIDHLINGMALEEVSSTKEENWLFRVIAYINENFRNNIRLDTMAEDLSLNKYFISRYFKQTVGCSLEQYINSLRVDYARNLLLFTNDSILDISLDSGFTNLSSFYRSLKEFGYGTPKQIRASQRKI